MVYYLLENAVPLLAELLFLLGALLLPGRWLIYIEFLFYLLLFCYFKWKRAFSCRAWKYAAEEGEGFYLPVLVTAGCYALCFLLTGAFPSLQGGLFSPTAETWPEILIFAVTTMGLAPITQELFYRQSLIQIGKAALWTAPVSLICFALIHGVSPQGILTAVIWGIPLTISYLLTKNIYVTISAHMLCSLLANGLDLFYLILFKLQ